MTGYFRDDGPLYELMLDEAGSKSSIDSGTSSTSSPALPCGSIRATSGSSARKPVYERRNKFDFARAEDKDAASEAKMGRFAAVYLARPARLGASDRGNQAIEDQFRIIRRDIRRVERERPRRSRATWRPSSDSPSAPIAARSRRPSAGAWRLLQDAAQGRRAEP